MTERYSLEELQERYEAGVVEQAAMHETLRARMVDMPAVFSLDEYIATCNDVGTPGADSSLLPQGPDLFRHLALDALPRVYPEIKPVHFAIDTKAYIMNMVEPDGLSNLPPAIEGVPIDEVLGYISISIADVAGKEGQQIDRIAMADGECTATSLRAVSSLVTAYEHLKPSAYLKRVEPAFRPSKPGEYFYPRLTGLSYGHTLIMLPYQEGITPMELLVDSTIAQVDRTNEYDMEVTAIQAGKVPNYLRLRYSTYPNAKVKQSLSI